MKTCSSCGKRKNNTSFRIDRNQCKNCFSLLRRKYYIKNKKRVRETDKKRTKSISLEIEKLKNVPCKDCENKYPTCCMDFDHIRGKKEFNISTGVCQKRFGLKKILKEINKCELVCANCHRIRTTNTRNACMGQPGVAACLSRKRS